MRLYPEWGQRPLAARQYEICRLTLAKELGILPIEETQTLYGQIFPEAHKSHVHCAGAGHKILKTKLGSTAGRIDIHIEVPRVDYEKLSGDRVGEPSDCIRARV
jgi:hypothetical protein